MTPPHRPSSPQQTSPQPPSKGPSSSQPEAEQASIGPPLSPPFKNEGAHALPPGWTLTTLGEITSINMGQSPDGNSTVKLGLGIPLLGGASDLSEEGPKASRATTNPTKLCNPGDVIFCIRATIGRACIADQQYCLGRGVAGFTGKAISSEYLRYFLNANIKNFESLGTGSTFIQINSKDISSFEIPLPPLAEQRRIVAKIEELTARSRKAREALDAIPALLEQFRQSVLASAFRGDLTADWRKAHPDTEPASALLERIRAERRRRFEEANPKKRYVEPEPINTTDLPELPAGWEWTTLEHLCLIFVDCAHRTPHYSDDGRGFPALRPRDVVGGKLNLASAARVPCSEYDIQTKRHIPVSGDIVYSRELSYGWAAVVPSGEQLCLSQGMVVFRAHESVDGFYLQMFLNGPEGRKQAELAAVGSAHPHINIGDIKSYHIALPSISEQRVIVDVLQDKFSLLASLSSALLSNFTDLGILDQSILAKAFRGELVPQDPADEPAEKLLERIRAERKPTEKKTNAQKSKKIKKTP